MELLLIIIGIIAIIWIAGSIIASNDRQKETDRQNRITSAAKNRLLNHDYLEKGSYIDGWSLVKLQDYRYAFVDRQGRALNNELFTSATPFKKGTAIVRKLDSGHGILRSDGSYAISCIEVPNKIDTYIKEIWSDIFLYSKTFYRKPFYVDHEDQYLVNRNGSYILNQPIDEVIEIKDNYIKIRLGKRIGEINFSGKFLSRPFRTKVDLGNGLFRVRDVEYGWGIYDENIDEIIIPCKYSEILFYKSLQIFILQPFGDGHRSLPCSIVNRKNEVIIPPKYDKISILEHKYIQASYCNNPRRSAS